MYLLVGYGFANQQVYKFLKNKRKKVIVYDDFIKNKKITNTINWNKIKTIIVSPGISYLNPIIIEGQNRNIPIKIDLDILYKYKKKTDIFVGVTGSNGKSTTCTMISFLLKQLGINNLLCGNIGKSIFNYKNKKSLVKNHIYIIEVSSFQANYMIDIRFNIGIITNISSNHDDWHGGKENYIKAKEKLLKFSEIPIYLNKLENNWKINDNKLIYKENIYNIWNSTLKLPHNKNNLLIALNIIEKLISLLNKKAQKIIYEKINNIKFANEINSFRGLKFRQEILLDNKNITIVNDSKSTNIASTISAINSFINYNNKKIILLIGGIIKGDLNLLNEKLSLIENIYIFGESKNILENHFKLLNINNYIIFQNLKELLEFIKINKNIYNNHTILFSPGGASYDEFKNYMERGKYFNIMKSII